LEFSLLPVDLGLAPIELFGPAVELFLRAVPLLCPLSMFLPERFVLGVGLRQTGLELLETGDLLSGGSQPGHQPPRSLAALSAGQGESCG
jgi:hypothetical protein